MIGDYLEFLSRSINFRLMSIKGTFEKNLLISVVCSNFANLLTVNHLTSVFNKIEQTERVWF